jgi:prevent-host-death family protein
MFMYYNMTMKTTNIAHLREKMAEYIVDVQNGEEIEVRKRNVPIARIVPVKAKKRNKTKLGSGIGTGKILGSLTDPCIPEADWEMLR